MPEPQFIWYELDTPDPDGAKAFYDEVVGWDIEPEPTGELDYRMIRLGAGGENAGGVMRLTDEMRDHGARPLWLGYIGVPDVDASVRVVEDDGGKVLMKPFDVHEVGRIALVADPQGAPFYLMTPRPTHGGEAGDGTVFSADESRHVRWNELSSSDPDAAIDFYARHFGFRQEGEMDMPVLSDAAGGVEGGEFGKYRFLYRGDQMIGAVMPKMPQMPVSLWSFYIGVDDIDRAAEAIRSGGGQILVGPMEIPGGEYSVNALDPQGASFGLVGPRKSQEQRQ